MVARVVAVVFLIGVIAGASTLHQVIDLQSDEIAASSNIDEFDRTLVSPALPPPHRQQVAIEWPTHSPNIRTHTLTVFRPPRLVASR